MRRLALHMIVFVACGDDASEPPADSSATTAPDTVEDLADVSETFVEPDGSTAPASAIIGPAGGTLTSSDGVVTISVLPETVVTGTTFSITPDLEAPQGTRRARAYRLGPEGITFARPIGVAFDYGAVELDDEADVVMLTYSEALLAWAPLGRSVVDVEADVVRTTRMSLSAVSVGDGTTALAFIAGALPVSVHEGGVSVASGGNDDTANGVTNPFASLEAACARVAADVPFLERGAGGSPIRVHAYHRVTHVAVGAGTFDGARCRVAVQGAGTDQTTFDGQLVLEVDEPAESSGFRTTAELRAIGTALRDIAASAANRTCVRLVDASLADSDVRGCAIGVRADSAGRITSTVVRDNTIGVAVSSAAFELLGNTFACNSDVDLSVDFGVTVDASGNAWDHVPPRVKGDDPFDNDYSGDVVTTGATLAAEPCIAAQ